jgi:hypothetical protein
MLIFARAPAYQSRFVAAMLLVKAALKVAAGRQIENHAARDGAWETATAPPGSS